MSAILILLFLSIGIASAFLIAFLWSVRDGQFDDDYSPARRILWDQTRKSSTTKSISNENPDKNN